MYIQLYACKKLCKVFHAEHSVCTLGNLAGIVDDQNHARPQRGHVAVIVLESGHGGVVGVGNRVQRLPSLHLVMDYSRTTSRGGLSSGRMLRFAGMPAG